MCKEQINEMFPTIYDKVRENDPLREKYVVCYPVLKKCFYNLLNKQHISDLLIEMNIHSVGLYAVNEFMDYILKDDGIARVETIRLYDKNSVGFPNGHLRKPVQTVDAMLKHYLDSEIEKIIICNITHGNEIADSFIKLGIRHNDLLTMDSLIFCM